MGKWSIVAGAVACVAGVAAQAIPGAGTAAGAALIALGCGAITTGGAVKDARVEKEVAKEKEAKEKEAQELQAADERLKASATSFGASASAVASTSTTEGTNRPAPARRSMDA